MKISFNLGIEKIWNMKVTIIPIVIGVIGTVTKALLNGIGGLGGKGSSVDHPNYNIVKNG